MATLPGSRIGPGADRPAAQEHLAGPSFPDGLERALALRVALGTQELVAVTSAGKLLAWQINAI